MHQMPKTSESYAGYAVNTIPVLCSPCLRCKNKNKLKETACQNCLAIEDFQLASVGDESAVERCLAFDYSCLGVKSEKVKTKIKSLVDDHYNELYYEKALKVTKEEYGVEFETLPEILLFLLQKVKNRTLVSKMIGGKPWTINNMTKKYNLPLQKELQGKS